MDSQSPRSMMASLAVMSMLLPSIIAQSCTKITPKFEPVMAPGYTSAVVMNGLKNPRGIVFDTLGNLLVVEQAGGGIRQIKFTDYGGVNVCVNSSKTIITDTRLNHGIDLSVDGKTLFVSSLTEVSSYAYDAAAGTVGPKKVLLNNMSNGGYHLTRTMIASKKSPGLLTVQRGSDGNVDAGTTSIDSGRSQVRVFNISAISSAAAPLDYSKNGEVLGWGLRNSVGWGEDPTTGGIWSVENSVDDMLRQGKDVHNTNPGEELNYHGVLGDPNNPFKGANYGYPTCFAAWDLSVLPESSGLQVGSQFAMNDLSATNSDAICATKQAPRLTFASHTAPLDVKFKADGSAAYISFHGSWDRTPPDGYRVSRIAFKNGQPVEPSNSTTAPVNIMWNKDNSVCTQTGICFRPCALAFDPKGRLFMTSDATNEIFVINGV